METTTTTTKTCSKCGQELPLTSFYPKKGAKDGLQYWCKECQGKMSKKYYKPKTITPPHSELSNPELASLQPREIIAQIKTLIKELRARGYNYEGKLTYLQEIKL